MSMDEPQQGPFPKNTPFGEDNPFRDNPYASPELQSGREPQGEIPPYAPSPSRGMVRHVPIVAILMMIQGGLETLMGLGLVGMGRIGQAVARRAQGCGMRILYHNRNRLDASLEAELGATWVPLQALLEQADFVSLHVPLSAATTHLIGAAELRLMQPTAYLINTARGPVVDEPALIRALQEGWIAGAALDVFEHEPNVPQALIELENVVLVPHIGSASIATRTRMAVMAAENLVAVVRGERSPYVVNPEIYGCKTPAE